MDISAVLCIITRTKVVHTSADCTVLLAGKSRSRTVVTREANESTEGGAKSAAMNLTDKVAKYLK